ncbi:MAG: magnesium/cobalt transporter CorA [Deltaproteobacteria bacterium]|nr:MAG: magnesium/cobalt transporter CorA [Deltaproteobacteria bacterium]
MTRRHHKRRAQSQIRSKPGAAPGAYELPEGGDVTLDAVRYDADTVEAWRLGGPEEIADLRRPGKVVWLDVCGLERRTVEALAVAFGLHPLAVEDAVHTHQRAKVERYANHELIVARMASAADGDQLASEQVSLFVGPGFVITVQERPGDPFEPVRERLRQGRGRIRGAAADYLAYALLDAIVDHYFPILEDLGDRIEELEEEIVTAPGDRNVAKIQALRRTLIMLRRATWPLRDAVGVLARGENDFFVEDTRVFLRDTLDHLLRIVDLVESYRDMVGGLMDLHLSMVSTRMNQVMQVLTVISTIFIPLTFIAGVYGMNFEGMPELHWPLGYPVVMALMGLIGAVLFWFFWRRGWIGRARRRSGVERD